MISGLPIGSHHSGSGRRTRLVAWVAALIGRRSKLSALDRKTLNDEVSVELGYTRGLVCGDCAALQVIENERSALRCPINEARSRNTSEVGFHPWGRLANSAALT